MSRPILLKAVELRAQYPLRTPDAMVLATAMISGATLTVSNDRAWQQVAETEILLLADLI